MSAFPLDARAGRWRTPTRGVPTGDAGQRALEMTKVTTPHISKSGIPVTSIGWYFGFSGRKYILGYMFHRRFKVNLSPNLATTIFLWVAVTARSITITSPLWIQAPKIG